VKRAELIVRLLATETFRRIWRGARRHDRAELEQMIDRNDAHGVGWWMECYDPEKKWKSLKTANSDPETALRELALRGR
jgi:hypothetical protein